MSPPALKTWHRIALAVLWCLLVLSAYGAVEYLVRSSLLPAPLPQTSGLWAQRYDAPFQKGAHTAKVVAQTQFSDKQDPGFRAQRFSKRLTGLVKTAWPGPYGFALESDDDSQLFINGRLVVDNRGAHPMQRRQGRVWLGPGQHVVEVTYSQRGGRAGLRLLWQPPLGAETPLPPEALLPGARPLDAGQISSFSAALTNSPALRLAGFAAWWLVLAGLLALWRRDLARRLYPLLAVLAGLLELSSWAAGWQGFLPAGVESGQAILVFSSPLFLFLFLPAALALYTLVGPRLRNLLLLTASLFFYSWGELAYAWILALSICGNYLFGRLLDQDALPDRRRRLYLAGGLAFNLLPLTYFKYLNFLEANLGGLLGWLGMGTWPALEPVHLPIGISFFTFQAISYLVDVYRGACRAASSPLKLGVYISMFPQLIAGPIVRYTQVVKDLGERRLKLDNWAGGSRRFILGLAKKVLIANTLGQVADQIMDLPAGELSWATAWLGIICYALQIFYDFSGYSDMAIGLGRILGFKFPENFIYPYYSQSVREFWRRWHITLSTWFRDYLYFPLGGNRAGRLKTYRNLIVVFVLCGIWHGASWNFLIWGLYHGLFLVLERTPWGGLLARAPRPLRHAYLLLVVTVGWVFFRIEELPAALDYLGVMLGLGGAATLAQPLAWYLNPQMALAGLIGLLGATPLAANLARRWAGPEAGWLGQTSALGYLALALLFSVIYVAGSTYNPFIYFRF